MTANPGAYALLLGSGISRSAGILTGWDITKDLVLRLAHRLENAQRDDWEKWYRERFQEDADYSRLLERLTSTSTERMTLLESYFEPNDDERAAGTKVPTPAHKAIARLVKLGLIRVIIQTNFDRLTEQALEQEGVVPDVLTSDEQIEAAVPLVHGRRVVLKVHGDYRDTRLKNTPAELKAYSETLTNYLARLFDEFGIIVCGWSATWDIALREVLLRARKPHFGWFWLHKAELEKMAEELVRTRAIETIPITDADSAFGAIAVAATQLKESSTAPVSVKSEKIAQMKRLLSEARHHIERRDLVGRETEGVLKTLSAEPLSSHGETPTKESFQARMKQYEAAVEPLAAMLTTLTYYDDESNTVVISGAVERLLSLRSQSGEGNVAWLALCAYPAVLLAYSAGIAAVSAGHFRNVAAILITPRYREFGSTKKGPAIRLLHPFGPFYNEVYKWVPFDNAERALTPPSQYLILQMREWLRELMPDEKAFIECFDLFEFIVSLVFADLVKDTWVPPGRYFWAWKHRWNDSPMAEFLRNAAEEGASWPPFGSGFFGSTRARLEAAADAVDRMRMKANESWLFFT